MDDYGERVASDASDGSEDLVVKRQQGTHAASMRVFPGRKSSFLRVQRGLPSASSYSNLRRDPDLSRTVKLSVGQSMIKVRGPTEIPDSMLHDFDHLNRSTTPQSVKRQQSLHVKRVSSSHLSNHPPRKTASVSGAILRIPAESSRNSSNHSLSRSGNSLKPDGEPSVVDDVVIDESRGSEISEHVCPICFEEEEEGEEKVGWCKVDGCSHRFHTVHILEFLRYWNRYTCPMCNGDIQSLILDNGEKLTADHLRKKFYSPPSGVKFNSEHNFSLFSEPDEVQALPLTLTVNEEREIVQQVGFPTIRLQIVDSDGRDCAPDGCGIQIKARHTCQGADLYNDSATVQSEGQCTFSNLVLQIPESTKLGPDDQVLMTFEVVCLGDGVDLPCHGVNIAASVCFPLDQREKSAVIRRASRQTSPPRDRAHTPPRSREPSVTPNGTAPAEQQENCGSREPVANRRPTQKPKKPESGKGGCDCIIL